MKRFLILIILSTNVYASKTLTISQKIKDNSHLRFLTHTGPVDSYENALALNVENKQIEVLREKISKHINKKLAFFKGWNENGEAHVTTITPPEFKNKLHPYISMKDINRIAKKMDIQSAKLKLLGIGSGKKIINGKVEETFFLIVDSNKLRNIRHQIYEVYKLNGGDSKNFDPTWFFPHITIGYTLRDLHENDEVIKNIKYGLDERFNLKVQ